MKTLTKSFWAAVGILSLSLLLSGCTGKSMDYQGYSAPASGMETKANDHASGVTGPTDSDRGLGSFNNDHTSGISGPTNPARGTERNN